MHGLTLRTKFIAGFAAQLVMVAALTFTAQRAMNSLNKGLDAVVHRNSVRADRASQLVETLVELTGHQQALLLHSILTDTAGVDQNRRAVAEAGECGPGAERAGLSDSAAVKAMRRWKFTPVVTDGKARKVVTEMSFSFKP